MRGIVITPPFKMDGESCLLISSDIDPLNLRQYALYWDRIDFPDNNVISVKESPECQFLMNAGVMKRTKTRFNSFAGNAGYAFALAQINAFQENNQKESGCWSIAQPNAQLVLPMEVCESVRTIEVELYDTLPVPSAAVSLEDILDFKEKRHNELLAFRCLMDSFYLDIVNSMDIPRAKTRTMEQLEQSIMDLHRTMSESKIKRFVASVKVELNLSDVIKDVVSWPTLTAAGMHYVFNLPPEIGAIIGLAASGIKVGIKSIPKINGLPKEIKDYAYLYHTQRELRY